ncbi:MAG: peptide ABC transporter permease, partial [Lautropia sp. SCN 66-9]
MSAQKVRMQPGLAVIIAAATLALIVIAALAAPLLPIPDPDLPDLHARSAPPFWLDGAVPGHLLGTDAVGRDLLSRLIHGARTSLAAVIGIGLGLVAGYFGGAVDTCVSFLITARLAMPVVLICLASVAVFGASFTVITAVLGAMLWDRFALVARSMTKSVRAADFVTAARLQGASTIRVLLTEVVPTIGNHLIVIATLEVGLAIVLESALSFLGMG